MQAIQGKLHGQLGWFGLKGKSDETVKLYQ